MRTEECGDGHWVMYNQLWFSWKDLRERHKRQRLGERYGTRAYSQCQASLRTAVNGGNAGVVPYRYISGPSRCRAGVLVGLDGCEVRLCYPCARALCGFPHVSWRVCSGSPGVWEAS